jgi:hypothetical protein
VFGLQQLRVHSKPVTRARTSRDLKLTATGRKEAERAYERNTTAATASFVPIEISTKVVSYFIVSVVRPRLV